MAQADGRQTYGRLRLLRAVWTRGMRVGDKRVRRLMRAAQLVARGRRRFRITTDSGHASPIVGHPLARQFAVQAPNRVWAADITALSTRDGWCYLAVVLDLYSRRLVGWAADTTLEPGLMLTALHRALMTRGVRPGLLHHSDRGSQYASGEYRAVLAAYGMERSMSELGSCWDNAVAESFFATLKTEIGQPAAWPTRRDASRAVFHYIELFYNCERRHSTLGYLSPLAFERQWRQQTAQ